MPVRLSRTWFIHHNPWIKSNLKSFCTLKDEVCLDMVVCIFPDVFWINWAINKVWTVVNIFILIVDSFPFYGEVPWKADNTSLYVHVSLLLYWLIFFQNIMVAYYLCFWKNLLICLSIRNNNPQKKTINTPLE